MWFNEYIFFIIILKIISFLNIVLLFKLG